jgi:hypothetical protein
MEHSVMTHEHEFNMVQLFSPLYFQSQLKSNQYESVSQQLAFYPMNYLNALYNREAFFRNNSQLQVMVRQLVREFKNLAKLVDNYLYKTQDKEPLCLTTDLREFQQKMPAWVSDPNTIERLKIAIDIIIDVDNMINDCMNDRTFCENFLKTIMHPNFMNDNFYKIMGHAKFMINFFISNLEEEPKLKSRDKYQVAIGLIYHQRDTNSIIPIDQNCWMDDQSIICPHCQMN